MRHPLKKVYPGYLRRGRSVVSRRIAYVAVLFALSVSVIASAGALTYRVRERDTLYQISHKFSVSQEQILLANGMKSPMVRLGEELIIPHDFYVVSPGEGLYTVARKSGVSLSKLLKINHLTLDTMLQPYMHLRIPVDADLQKVHIVREHDTWEILEELYGIPEKKLRQYSGMTRDQDLDIGREIWLVGGMVRDHLVQEGETLYSLSVRYGVSVDQLMQFNALNTDVIRSGQKLQLTDPVVDNTSSNGGMISQQASDSVSEEREIPPLLDPREVKFAYLKPSKLYFNREPTSKVQPSAHYAEPHISDVESDYKEAISLYQHFKEDVASLPRLSNTLNGYRIVLDPGHGGYDPGALGSVTIDGKRYYLVEDEYVYDIALRLYAILVQHGAEVEMTILAPNHTIRDNSKLESFVNQKNEVYNDPQEMQRPVGGRWGLRKRLEITQRFLKNQSSKKSIFMSLHADSGDVKGLVLTGSDSSVASRNLAKTVIQEFGRGKILEGDYLVLLSNPAYASVLVEVRTMSEEEASYLLDPKQRQMDAQSLANAILKYAVESGS
nr:LysM peptidoglycan-binding domain-containing protein [Entomospira entomophilus]